VGALAAGAWPQLASIANARNATIIVDVNLEAVIAYSFDIVIVNLLPGLSFDGFQTSHLVICTSFTRLSQPRMMPVA
jgi:hypothetical protein